MKLTLWMCLECSDLLPILGCKKAVGPIPLEILLIILLLGGFLYFTSQAKSTNYKKSPRKSSTYRKPPQSGTFSSKGRQAKLEPFDAKTTKPLTDAPTLNGAAYIVDGDTVIIQKTQIRLFGVDAPEMNHPYGKNAKWALVRLCKGKIVRAEVSEQDAHGRTVARCYLPDGRDLSAEMVKLGLAIDWPKYSGGIYRTMEVADARKKMWLADARQKGRMHVWEKYEARQKGQTGKV